MTLYSDPPPLRTFYEDKPSLLVCWWTTAFCTTIILLRVAGRFIRTEHLFLEDRVAAIALVPLYMRMACVHVVLLYGSNNAQLDGANLSDQVLHEKAIASGVLLAARILYAATLWILKDAILQYFKRLTESVGERYAAQTLLFIRVVLAATFIAVVVSTLAECQPFTHYWQVVPDPGGQCRQGYAQLITLAACNVITDLMLVIFPIPMILRSNFKLKKKLQLTLLFSLSLAPIVVTCYRVPHIIDARGSQQLRSLLASVELLFATTAANSLVLGSFVRDRGVKKKKFKYGSIAADSLDRSITSRQRRPTLQRHWGSDEDLVRDMGISVEPELRDIPDSPSGPRIGAYSPTPTARRFGDDLKSWEFPQRERSHAGRSDRSDDSLLPRDPLSNTTNSTSTPRRVSFFDVGGLLAGEPGGSSTRTNRRESYLSGIDPLSSAPLPVHNHPSPVLTTPANGQRRGSKTLLQDLGGFFGLPASPSSSSAQPNRLSPRSGDTELQSIPQQSQHVRNAIYDPAENGGPELNDVGGLLK